MKHWRPSVTARREFAKNMSDPDFRAAYEARKEAKREKKIAGSSYDYSTAGGSFIPTQIQRDAAFQFLQGELTTEQAISCQLVMSGHDCQSKVHHDHIHLVNELIRKI